MGIPRYYTLGAVATDVSSLKGLAERLEALDLPPESVVVLTRRRDERLVRALSCPRRARKAWRAASRAGGG